jgi:hypothetical protein
MPGEAAFAPRILPTLPRYRYVGSAPQRSWVGVPKIAATLSGVLESGDSQDESSRRRGLRCGDPAIAKDELLSLTEPTIPTPQDVNPIGRASPSSTTMRKKSYGSSDSRGRSPPLIAGRPRLLPYTLSSRRRSHAPT